MPRGGAALTGGAWGLGKPVLAPVDRGTPLSPRFAPFVVDVKRGFGPSDPCLPQNAGNETAGSEVPPNPNEQSPPPPPHTHPLGDPEIAPEKGEGAVARTPAEGRGGGWRNGLPCQAPLLRVTMDVGAEAPEH